MFEITDSGEARGAGKVAEPKPEWIEEQCARFERVLGGFTAEMRTAFRRRAMEGRARWEDPGAAEKLQMDLLAHAYYKPLCAGEEAHVANFAAFLWGLRTAPAREPVRFDIRDIELVNSMGDITSGTITLPAGAAGKLVPPKVNALLRFHREDGVEVGSLDFNGDALVFRGKAEESAEVFLAFVAERFKQRLQDEFDRGMGAALAKAGA